MVRPRHCIVSTAALIYALIRLPTNFSSTEICLFRKESVSLQHDKDGFTSMNAENKYIRFDWAVKRMLRDKANFVVLEGLITVLLGQRVEIVEIIESESNQDSEDDKYNRVDVKAKNDLGEIFIVEVQLTRQLYYLERILYGVAKTLTEHIKLGKLYNEVKKVYHISIVYFDLGQGADYLYHGQTKFIGVHTNDELKVNTKEEQVIQMKTPAQVFPEYFIIRVNEFNDIATTPLEEWLDYLKNGNIRDDTTAPGLSEAKEKLKVMTMTQNDRRAYYRHLDALMVQEDVLSTAKKEGLAEGWAEGRAEGRAEGKAEGRAEGFEEANIENARKMKALGMTNDLISKVTGLSIEEIKSL